jgi:hypothetical protein
MIQNISEIDNSIKSLYDSITNLNKQEVWDRINKLLETRWVLMHPWLN